MGRTEFALYYILHFPSPLFYYEIVTKKLLIIIIVVLGIISIATGTVFLTPFPDPSIDFWQVEKDIGFD